LAGIAVAVAALALPPAATAYGWPVRPFDRPHPIRAGFGDPRIHEEGSVRLTGFHFGVDISVPDGTPVYAMEPGVVTAHSAAVTVGRRGGREFGYYHIRPVVHTGQAVRTHRLLGYVLPGWSHLHFSEAVYGHYRNPLRLGALEPFSDGTRPTVALIRVTSPSGTPLDPAHLTGVVAIQADVYDTPALAPPSPWWVARLAPAKVRWRLMQGARAVLPWLTTIDFGFRLMPADLFDWVYAPGTFQNKPNRPGRYLFWVEHGLDTNSIPDGRYTVDVQCLDTRGNRETAFLPIAIENAQSLSNTNSGSR
jgi:murein DD-endopeptidase MepM/ murein hydrolase activator NlpD